jgi:PAS domain S-box-containing protein
MSSNGTKGQESISFKALLDENRVLKDEVQNLRERLEEAEELSRAISEGDLDALVIPRPEGELIFTLDSADQAYRVLVETMNEGTSTLAFDGTILYCNHRFAELLRTPLQAVIGTSIYRFIAPESTVTFNALLKQEKDMGEINLRAEGDVSVPVYLSVSSFQAEGSPNAWCLVVTDLTDQKKNEEILASERLARSIIEQAAETIVVCDTSGRITRFSNAMPRLYGCDPTFQIFDDFMDLRFSEMEEAGERIFPVSSALKGSTIIGMEVVFELDCQKLHFLLNSGPLKNDNGEIVGCVVTLTDITERKRAEDALRESEERFRALVTASSEALYRMSPDWSEMLQLHSRSFLANTERPNLSWFQEYIPQDDQPHVTAAINEAIRKKSIFELEHRVWQADGSLGWTFSRAIPLMDANGEIFEWFGAASDITERKRVEKALYESEKRYSALFNARTNGIAHCRVVIDEQGKSVDYIILEVNNAYEEITGIKKKDIEGKKATEVFPGIEHFAYDYIRNYGKVALEGSELTIEVFFETLQQWLSIYVYSPKYGDFIAIFSDITNRKEIEAKLKETLDSLDVKVKERTAELEEAYNSLLENEIRLNEAQKIARIGNWDWNLLKNKLYWSNGMYRIFGLDPLEFGGTYDAFLDSVHPDDRDYVDNAVKEALSGKPFEIDYRIISANGEERIVYSQGKVVSDEKYTPIRMKGIVQDITERKKAEEALEKMDKVRIKEIHHRIKNNLQVISSLLDLQAEKFEDEMVKEAFREGQNRVISMSLLHEEFYRGEGTDTVDFSVYLQKLAENLFQTYSLSSKDIRLNMNLEENAFLDMDTAVPLGIIVNELISNSLKHAFTEKQEGEIRIQFCREEKNDEMQESLFSLTISDNGKGIPEDLELENAESLGLQLVGILVDQLDGKIEIKREQGTEFRITYNIAETSLPPD